MKKVLISLLTLFLIPIMVSAKGEKVKVYIFEAGGCPWCEKEIEYLKGLDSYNKKFTIVSKKLYVDHENWAPDKDFKTGVKVSDAFNAAGFEDASYSGTPFVVISDLYAATAYDTDLEKIIDEAYEKGDKDVVGCIEKGKDGCLKDYKASEAETNAQATLEAVIESQLKQCLSQDGSNCTEPFEDTENKELANTIYSEVVEDFEASGGTVNTVKEAESNISATTVVILVLSSIVVFGLMIFGAKYINKDNK